MNAFKFQPNTYSLCSEIDVVVVDFSSYVCEIGTVFGGFVTIKQKCWWGEINSNFAYPFFFAFVLWMEFSI